MRILHVFDHSIPLHSGYTFRSAAILRGQRALGWETVHVTSSRQGPTRAPEEEVDGIRFQRTPPIPRAVARIPLVAQLADMRRLRKRLLQVARAARPDILHAHSPVLNAFPALSVGRELRIPVVYEVRAFWEDAAVDHGTTTEGSVRYRVTRALETLAFSRADAVTCICEGLREDILSRGIPSERVTVIPNAVDTEKFAFGAGAESSRKSALGLDGHRIIGFVGSFYAYEGLDLLIAAMPALLANVPDIRLLLVGGGPQENNLRLQAAALGISDKVVFAGRVPHEQVNRYYAAIDVLVYARHSMRLTELVTPLKPLEAMAQGQLFVASDVGGHRELVRNGETGVLFKAGDKAALASAVLGLLGASESWDRLRLAGRRYVETERTWSDSVARYREVYRRLAAR